MPVVYGKRGGTVLLNRRFALVDTEILEAAELDPQEKLLFVVLASHYNHSTGQCNPSIARLVKVSGLSHRTVVRRLESLERKGFIGRERRTDETGRRTSNGYILQGYAPDSVTLTPAWCQADTQTTELNNRRNQNNKITDSAREALSGAKIAPIYPTAEEVPLLVELPEEWRVAQ